MSWDNIWRQSLIWTMGSQAFAGPESRKKIAQSIQTLHYPLRIADIAKLLEKEDWKGFMPMQERSRKQGSSQKYIDGLALYISFGPSF